ncbi:hypothetical protein Slin15195_G067690 [Septoria linicola]|uniref:Uncharacterized protein n=1 Tax=Septoria linicola TaxID=215465 RepID=A0A9Q9AQV9_9PEZI|nr:hypothetical protein Slin15195_G067690 [Septoria linicola]
MELMVDLVEGVKSWLDMSERRLKWVHMPVPKWVEEEDFFGALGRINWDWTELVLGLVHAGDLDGTTRRTEMAGKLVDKFGVSTACGLGRSTKDDLESVMETYSTVLARS